MRKTLLCLRVSTLFFSFYGNKSTPQEQIFINLLEKYAVPYMYGISSGEINQADNGALYAELIKSRFSEGLKMPEGYHTEVYTLYPVRLRL
jgi:hypothetical protein